MVSDVLDGYPLFPMSGKFITLEGPEGSGKSTQAKMMIRRLGELGIEAMYTREPGGTALGEEIRNILQHNQAGEAPCERAELLLFEASRNQLVEKVIRPHLEKGIWVICDRFIDSTTAYQGFGRGLPIQEVQAINRFTINDVHPDLTLLLDLGKPLLGMRFGLLCQLALGEFQLDEAPLHFIDFRGYAFQLHGQAACRLVHEVNCLVGKKPVADIAVRECRGGDQGRIGNPDTMMSFIAFLETPKNGNRRLN